MNAPSVPPPLILAFAIASVLLPFLVILIPTSWPGRRVAAAAAALCALSFACAFGAALAGIVTGPYHQMLSAWNGWGPSMHLDVLSGIMLMLVSFLGAVVTRYSVNYLDGDSRHGVFARWLAATTGCVLLLVLSGNLVQFVAAWIGTSLCLHQLLVFYRDRPAAIAAAREKFIASRLADLCMVIATVMVWRQFGTVEFHELFARASEWGRQGNVAEGPVVWIAFLLVGAAVLKSAQFPFHSWLPDSLETPTPVSALMHAGIINAGGYLIVRLSPLVSLCPAALNTLAAVGAVTAVFASVVMMTQTSIKRSLAWSTVSQMGFMMLQCGLGAFALAVLHIVAHSLYKAHAFLSSGGVIGLARSAWQPAGWPSRHPVLVTVVLGVAVGVTLLVGRLSALPFSDHVESLLLASIFAMALAYLLWNLWQAPSPAGLFLWGGCVAGAAAVAWFAAHRGALELLSPVVPVYAPPRTGWELGLMAAILCMFFAVLVFQGLLPVLEARPALRRVYVHARNGFYVGTLVNRFANHLSR